METAVYWPTQAKKQGAAGRMSPTSSFLVPADGMIRVWREFVAMR